MRSGAAIKYVYDSNSNNQIENDENSTQSEPDEVRIERIFEPTENLKLPIGMLIVIIQLFSSLLKLLSQTLYIN